MRLDSEDTMDQADVYACVLVRRIPCTFQAASTWQFGLLESRIAPRESRSTPVRSVSCEGKGPLGCEVGSGKLPQPAISRRAELLETLA